MNALKVCCPDLKSSKVLVDQQATSSQLDRILSEFKRVESSLYLYRHESLSSKLTDPEMLTSSTEFGTRKKELQLRMMLERTGPGALSSAEFGISKKAVEEKHAQVKTELKEDVAKVTKVDTAPDIAAVAKTTWNLPGVEVCDEMTVVVFSSHSQQITWEGFGLRLHIDEDSLPAGIEQCTLKIMASLAGQYEFPENSCLVSAVFWLRCEPTCKFTKPVTVEIQHCAKSENVGNLGMKFVRAMCSQKQLPYTFKELEGGDFNRHSSYGVIQVNSFSGMAVTQEGSEDREYCSQLFYLGQPSFCRIHFVVTWNVEAHLTVVKEEYRKKGASLSLFKLVDFESHITLDIPVEGITVKDWEITPLIPPMVTKKQVDNFRVGKVTPCCQLLARTSKKSSENIPSITHRISLKGSKLSDDFFLINLPYGDSLTLGREQTSRDLESMAVEFGHFGAPPHKRSRLEDDDSLTSTSACDPAKREIKPELKDLLKELYNKVSHSWKAIGIMLGLDPDVLDAIKTSENNMSQSCLREMLTVWMKQINPPPSWSAIADAIESLGDEELAEHLRTKFVTGS